MKTCYLSASEDDIYSFSWSNISFCLTHGQVVKEIIYAFYSTIKHKLIFI